MKKNPSKREVVRKIKAEIAKCKNNIKKICIDAGMSYESDFPADAADNIMFDVESNFSSSELYRFKPVIEWFEYDKRGLNRYLERCRKGGWKENSK